MEDYSNAMITGTESEDFDDTCDIDQSDSEIELSDSDLESNLELEHADFDDIKGYLCRRLEKTFASGSFAHYGSLPDCPNPGLHLKGLGAFGLPLSERDAKLIMESPLTKRSPFGKGSQTVVDTTVRKTWQVEPKDIQIKNPKFQAQIDATIQKVTEMLGVEYGASNVKAQMHKLLLYEEGAFFLPHQDTEKESRMFGTLAICLPSEHQGGDLVLSHAGKNHTYRSAEDSTYDYSYAAWYSDVTHEVKPVTSGYRLVLIYNLVQLENKLPASAALASASSEPLRKVLSKWTDLVKGDMHTPNGFLAYQLAHQYTEASFSFQSLKGSDYRHVQNLIQAAEGQYVLYLARQVKKVSCENYGYGSDEDGEDSLELKSVIDEAGSTVISHMSLDMHNIADENMYREREADEEESEGYTGNEDASVTYTYHDSVVLIIPRQCLVNFKFEAYTSRVSSTQWEFLHKSLTELVEQVEKGTNSLSYTDLRTLCGLTIKTASNESYCWEKVYRQKALETIIAAGLLFSDILLIQQAIGVVGSTLSLNVFDQLYSAASKYGPEAVHLSLKAALGQITLFGTKREALLRFSGGVLDKPSDQLTDWERELQGLVVSEFRAFFGPESELSAVHGKVLADIASCHGLALLVEEGIPLSSKSPRSPHFIFVFITHLVELGDSNQVPRASLEAVYGDMLGHALEHFTLSIPNDSRIPTSYYMPGTFRSEPEVEKRIPRPEISPTTIVQIIKDCAAMGHEQHAQRIFSIIDMEANRATSRMFDQILIPYLTQLFTHLQEASTDIVCNHPLAPHTRRILGKYLDKAVGPEPQRPTTWARPTKFLTCACADCRTLKLFLQDKRNPQGIFTMPKKRRQHLEENLVGQCHETGTDARGQTHSLIVTKSARQFNEMHRVWKASETKAKALLRKLAQNPKLKELLGEHYESTMRAQPIPLDAMVMPLATVLNGAEAKGGRWGQKRAAADGEENFEPELEDRNERDEGGGGKRMRMAGEREVVDLVSD